MRYFITLPFNVGTYRKILDKYWTGKDYLTGSLGFYKKSDKSKVKTYHKYFFGGRVPVNCIDYDAPVVTPPSFNNFYTDWTPLWIDDMMVIFKSGASERMCSRYIFIIDELKDNEIIRWEENGRTRIGAFDATTGGVSVSIDWGLSNDEVKRNNKLWTTGKRDKLIKPVLPSLYTSRPLIVDNPWTKKPELVDWGLINEEKGIRGIEFAVVTERKVLGELVEKRIGTHMITLKRLLKKGDMEKAIELGNWINRLKVVLGNCKDEYYRI